MIFLNPRNNSSYVAAFELFGKKKYTKRESNALGSSKYKNLKIDFDSSLGDHDRSREKKSYPSLIEGLWKI